MTIFFSKEIFGKKDLPLKNMNLDRCVKIATNGEGKGNQSHMVRGGEMGGKTRIFRTTDPLLGHSDSSWEDSMAQWRKSRKLERQ